MSDLFARWILRTSKVSLNATSSQASASGATRSDLPDGPTIDPSGQVPALASLSARQAKERGLLTSGTFGPRSTTSSASAALQLSLANRLRAKTVSRGSTLYKLTWKDRVTPAQQPICALRASARRTSDSASTGWPTTGMMDGNRAGTAATYEGWLRHAEKHKAKGVNAHFHLNAAADAAGWPTPTTRDWKDGSPCDNVPVNALLGRTAWLAGWPTPVVNDETGSTHAYAGGRQQQDRAETAGGRKDVRPGRFLSARELAGIPYEGNYVDPARNSSPTNGHWRDADWLFCRDGKWRPVEPGTFPLAYGATSRVGRLRAYGNAIVPQVAQTFIEAYLETA